MLLFKKTLIKNPQKLDEAGLYYPKLITMGKSVDEELIVHQIKELSSLSKGDIKSVLTNFFDVVRTNLYSGHTVNIRNFGLFSLNAQTEGTEEAKDCTAKKIKSVRISFRASKAVRPDVNATRAEDKISFVDLDTYLKDRYSSTDNNNPGGGNDNGGNGDGGDDFIDPSA